MLQKICSDVGGVVELKRQVGRIYAKCCHTQLLIKLCRENQKISLALLTESGSVFVFCWVDLRTFRHSLFLSACSLLASLLPFFLHTIYSIHNLLYRQRNQLFHRRHPIFYNILNYLTAKMEYPFVFSTSKRQPFARESHIFLLFSRVKYDRHTSLLNMSQFYTP